MTALSLSLPGQNIAASFSCPWNFFLTPEQALAPLCYSLRDDVVSVMASRQLLIC